MQPKPLDIQIADGLRGVQGSQLEAQALCMAWPDACGIAGAIEPGKALVAKGFDHGQPIADVA